jgi:phenylacetate-CoA ligase
MRLSRRFRKAVTLSPLPEGLQVTDTSTGFAVELSARQAGLLAGSGPASERLWQRLHEMGLVDSAVAVAEARRLQRKALFATAPPLLERLRARLAQIRCEVPYFKRSGEIYDPQRLKSIADFESLPFMRKRDVRTQFPSGLLPEGVDVARGLREGDLVIVSTSGTTEERLQVVCRSLIDRLPFGSDELLGISLSGRQPRTAIFTTPLCSAGACRATGGRGSIGSTDLILPSTDNPFDMPAPLIEDCCEQIERFKPTILAANPLYLQCLIRRARELRLPIPRVELVQRGFEFGTGAAVREIGNAFGVPVLNDYGASEENRLAIECHRGSLHVRADVVHFEILNSAGPCPPGVVGAVALTTFDTLMPLVRYLIGDAAAWTGTACECEFSQWPSIELHGRIKDMLWGKNRWVSTLEIDQCLGSPSWLDCYRVIQVGEGRFVAHVIPAPGSTPDCDSVAQRLHTLLGSAEIRVKPVTRLDPLPSLKIGVTENRTEGAPEIL